MTIPPPPPPDRFIVRGQDGKDYPVDAPTLRAWAASGRIIATHQIYSDRTQRWSYASEIPLLTDIFSGAKQGIAGTNKDIGCLRSGCIVLIVLFAIGWLVSLCDGSGSSRSQVAPESPTPAAPVSVAPPVPVFAGTPAQRRVAAAADLQQRFDASLLKGWELKFAARGRQCDALHVEGYTNLEKSMMESLAYGTLIYGKVLPGGVNSYAFSNGFRDVVYTNEEGATYLSFGETKLTRKRIRSMRRCTDEIAKSVAKVEEKPVSVPEAPRFQQLSWENAKVGTKLYDGSYQHDATIVSVNRASDLIEVRYIRSGTVEPKTLSAVARFWYVKQ